MTTSPTVATEMPTFALPGRWWRVPLETPEATTASVRSMARSLCPGDELAVLRRDVQERVSAAAAEATKAGARAFHFAIEVVPGAPVPLTLGIYEPTLPPRLSAQGGALASAEALAVSLRSAEPNAAVSSWGDDELGIVRVLSTQAPTADSEVDRPVLRADYWLTAPATDATTVFSFAAPVIWDQTAPALLELLDAIISTVRWSPGGNAESDLA
ncbi:hypothetical protein KDN32_17035 [Nocardioides sp. J2M5]|uniref:hypothetical protein n=1 Tax=Nocardioides palaemonis TaxID=2829810 RepID=UPI001BA4FAF1|nr:hypothetical protein [Nocardioides palaemonis]MBS2939448.1 hypothetical protein [Nocardioides palaemonis]